ncbi:MAG: hypothetical protein ABIZ80_12660 [Bryobacteraceae bacterium]
MNVDAERGRYCMCLEELEGHLAARLVPVTDFEAEAPDADQIAAVSIDGRYFDFLARYHLEENERKKLGGDLTSEPAKNNVTLPGLGTSIFPPDTVEFHIAAVEEMLAQDTDLPEDVRQVVLVRQLLLRQIAARQEGVIEIGELLDNLEAHLPPPRHMKAQAAGASATPSGAAPEIPLKAGKRKIMELRLRQAVEAALPGGKINMSNQPHEVTTEVLAEFVTCAEGEVSGVIRVVYADGSEARPFPLRCLPPSKARDEPEVLLKAALMSMRHLEIDPLVDFAWFRNREVSQTRALADSDAFCFEYSQKQFAELRAVYRGKRVTLHLYHTGFEPAALGFYRALTLTLQQERWITVVPHYFRGEEGFARSFREWR